MIQMRVTRQGRQFDGDPEMPLLWFLRDELHLTGTKYGCGVGMCGACTVHVNGEAARACLTPMKDAAGKVVTTIEGLAVNGDHPLQKKRGRLRTFRNADTAKRTDHASGGDAEESA